MPFLTQGKTNWKYIIIFLVIAVIIGVGVIGLINQKESFLFQLPEIKKKEETEETTDWKSYKNEEYGFEMKYPSNWKMGLRFGEKREAALGGGASFQFEFPTKNNDYYPDAILGLTVFNVLNPILAYSGDWGKIANDFFEVGFIITNLEKIDFKGRDALRGRSCQKHFKEERCQTEFTGGRNQQEIEDSLYVNSPDGKWLFILSLLRFEPNNKGSYFTDVYEEFLNSFKFTQP